jgi:hypothetical protein
MMKKCFLEMKGFQRVQTLSRQADFRFDLSRQVEEGCMNTLDTGKTQNTQQPSSPSKK